MPLEIRVFIGLASMAAIDRHLTSLAAMLAVSGFDVPVCPASDDNGRELIRPSQGHIGT